MTDRQSLYYRWAWFALTCCALSGWAWTHRFTGVDVHSGIVRYTDHWRGEFCAVDRAGVRFCWNLR